MYKRQHILRDIIWPDQAPATPNMDPNYGHHSTASNMLQSGGFHPQQQQQQHMISNNASRGGGSGCAPVLSEVQTSRNSHLFGANAPMMFNPSLYKSAPDPPSHQQEYQQRPPTMGYQELPRQQVASSLEGVLFWSFKSMTQNDL